MNYHHQNHQQSSNAMNNSQYMPQGHTNNQYCPQQHDTPHNYEHHQPKAYQEQCESSSYNPAQQGDPQKKTSDFDPNMVPGGKYYSIKVHGGKAAIEFKTDTTRKGVKTIRIEAAQGANKKFNWTDKISIQLTHTGLIDIISAFLFIKPVVELKHYGANNDKSIKVEYQQGRQGGGKLFVQVSQIGKNMLGVPVPINEAVRIGQFALDQYLKNYDRLSADVVLKHLQRAAQL